MLARVRDQLRAQQMSLEVTQAAKDHIIKIGYDVAYGARPLRRVIQNMIEDVLAEHLLLGRYEPGTTIVVDKGEEAGLDDPRRRGEDPGRAVEAVLAAVARPQSRYVCQACGEAFLRWEGQCRACGGWNTLVETVVREPSRGARRRSAAPGRARRPMPAWPRSPSATCRACRSASASSTASSAAGSCPGRSSSSAASRGSASRRSCSRRRPASPRGGRRPRPVRDGRGVGRPGAACARAASACSAAPAADAVRVLAEHDVGRIVEAARGLRPAAVVVDSIQTATVDELDGPAGSVGQVRESALRLMELAKGDGIAVVLVGHVTKDGSLAGPKTLEHLVDAVVSTRGRAGRHAAARCGPRRTGSASTDEVGVFEMGESGLREVPDPARAFLVDHEAPAPGSVVAATLEGSRPLLVEVQALVAATAYGTPAADRDRPRPEPARPARRGPRPARRGRASPATTCTRTSPAASAWWSPGLDLPLAIALASSLRDRPVRAGTVAIGEVGLLGELRGVAGLERRLREAARLGFGRAIVPRPRAAPRPTVEGLEVVAVATLREALGAALAAAGELSDPGDACRGGLTRPPGGARLTPRDPCPSVSSGPPSGLLVGLAFLVGGALFGDGAPAGVPHVAWVVAWVVVGFAVICRTSRSCPPRWLIRRVQELSTAEFVTAVLGLLIGLLMGLLLGLPLAAFPPPLGTWLPLGVSLMLGLGMVGPDRRQAARPRRSPPRRSAWSGARRTRTTGPAPRRAAHRRRHERDHRRADRRHRRVRLHLRDARRAAVRARRAAAHRRQPRHAAPEPRPAGPRDPRPDAEGRPRRRSRSSRTTCPTIAEVDAKLVALARARSRDHPDQRLQPQPGRRAAGRPGDERQLAGQRGEAGRPARARSSGSGSSRRARRPARASASSTTGR